jgi:hypothetical protein
VCLCHLRVKGDALDEEATCVTEWRPPNS